jgi:DNA-binding beta-propeller fold protein YncE
MAATTPVGFGAYTIALDKRTGSLYVPNISDTSVSIINAAACNALRPAGCARSWAKDAVGNDPFAIALDPQVGTGYVTNKDGTVSLIPLAPKRGS